MIIADNPGRQELLGCTSDVSNLPTTAGRMTNGQMFNAVDGSLFLDTDTGTIYIFYDGEWKEMGADE